MNDSTIVVAGATGNLGGRIARALLERGASTRALVRHGTARDRLERLQELGITIASVDLSRASQGRGMLVCVLVVPALRDCGTDGKERFSSTLNQGGGDVSCRPITRSISPSFRPERIAISICAGISTSASIRSQFQRPRSSTARLPICDRSDAAHSLQTEASPRSGRRDQRMDFTTMDDTAAFTASAALSVRPRFLRIAGDQLSARELTAVVE